MKRRQYLSVAGAVFGSGCSMLGRNSTTTPNSSSLDRCQEAGWAWQAHGASSNTGVAQGTDMLGTTSETNVLYTGNLNTRLKTGSNEGVCYVVTEPGDILAVDIESKEQLWNYSLPRSATCSPVIGCDSLYIQTSSTTHCLEIRTGEERWQVDHGSISPAELIPHRGYLYGLGARGIRRFDPKSGESQLLYEESQSLIWGLSLKGNNLFATLSADSNRASDKKIIALDHVSGKTKWKRQGYESKAPPVATENTVYVVTVDGIILSLSNNDGVLKWETNTGGNRMVAPPAVDTKRERLFVPTGEKRTINALDTESGQNQWETELHSSNIAITQPIIGSETLIAASYGVFGLDPETGHKQWRQPIGSVSAPFDWNNNYLLINRGNAVVQYE